MVAVESSLQVKACSFMKPGSWPIITNCVGEYGLKKGILAVRSDLKPLILGLHRRGNPVP